MATDSVAVFCEPHVLTRGDTVSCLIYIGSKNHFVVNSRLAQDLARTVFAISGGRDTVSGGQDSIYASGDTARWRGPAVASSRVDIHVEWTDSLGFRHSPSATDSFTVKPRVLPEYAIGNAPREFRDSVKPGKMTDYPFHNFVDATGVPAVDSAGHVIPISATYGLFVRDSIFKQLTDNSLKYAQQVEVGPNAGILWFSALPPLVDYTEVWIHPALKGGGTLAGARLWYRQQDGGTQRELFPHDSTILHDTITAPDTLVRHVCSATDVANLKALAERHEGVGAATPSHFSILTGSIATAGLRIGVESLYVQLFRSGDDIGLSNAVISLVNPIIKRINDNQHDFEQPEYDRIFGKFGPGAEATDLGLIKCRIRYDRNAIGTIVLPPFF